jgi:5-methylthioadenosine/S-adenosylhomocysteine deaminase
LHGPEVLPANRALRMATIDGARAMGLDREIGSLEPGKRADVTVLDIANLHSTPKPADLASTIVYSAQPHDVQTAIIDGRLVMKNRELLTLNEAQVIADANNQAADLFRRAGLGVA